MMTLNEFLLEYGEILMAATGLTKEEVDTRLEKLGLRREDPQMTSFVGRPTIGPDEDQVLVRDWSWVVDAMNKAHADGVNEERERCAKVLDALAEEYEDRSRRAELRTWADANWAEARVVRGCARAIREAGDE